MYNGKELVNSLIYLGIVVFLPFIFSFFSIFTLLFKREKKSLEALSISYLFGIFFSLGALSSLLFIVTTQDLAFGWATTLNIKASELSGFLNAIAIWKSFCSSCIVDEHLAKISEFIRLGGAISKEQIKNAKELGSWWKFLAMAIVTYGILFRAILYLIVKFVNKEQKVNIISDKNEESLEEISSEYNNKITQNELKNRVFRVIPYYTNIPAILKNTPDAKDIVVVVKSWEPPILDFFDFLEELQNENKNAKISIFLSGLNGKADKENIDIWLRKLNELRLNYEIIV